MQRKDLKAGDKVIVLQIPPSRSRYRRYDEKVPKGDYHEATVIDPKATYPGYRNHCPADIPAVEIEITAAVDYYGNRDGAGDYRSRSYARTESGEHTAKIGERIKVQAKVILSKAEDHAEALEARKRREEAGRKAREERKAKNEALLARYEAIGVEAKIGRGPYETRDKVIVTESAEDLIERLEAAAKVTV